MADVDGPLDRRVHVAQTRDVLNQLAEGEPEHSPKLAADGFLGLADPHGKGARRPKWGRVGGKARVSVWQVHATARWQVYAVTGAVHVGGVDSQGVPPVRLQVTFDMLKGPLLAHRAQVQWPGQVAAGE